MRTFCVFLSAMLLSACALPNASAPASLARALALLPVGDAKVTFTDWSLIRQYVSAKDLSSQSPIEQRVEFIARLSKDQSVASAYGVAHMLDHAKVWGWDSTDLDWEASTVIGQPAYVLKFRDEFDLAPVLAHFDERGFAKSEYKGATLYSHKMEPAEWLRATEFAILNTAVLKNEKIFAMSSTPDPVRSLLDVYKREAKALGDDSNIQTLANRLGSVASAYLDPAASDCHVQLGPNIPDVLRKWMEEQSKNAPTVHDYSALAIGYRIEKDKPLGLIVLRYQNASDAQADVEPRRQLAQGPSLLSPNRTIPELRFRIASIAAQDRDLVMRVEPAGDKPRVLFDMVTQRDMLWAGCLPK